MKTVIISSTVAIVVAILGGIFSVVAEIIQSKKQGQTVTNIKDDTSDMKPKISNTAEDTKSIKTDFDRTVIPHIQQFKETQTKIDALYDEQEYKKRLNTEVTNGYNKDRFIAGIENICNYNAAVTAENRNLKIALEEEKEKNLMLTNEINTLQKQAEKRKDTREIER